MDQEMILKDAHVLCLHRQMQTLVSVTRQIEHSVAIT